uniref:non-specific serine/threonine protein kinase n=1 Tax=Fagus sylvatica TaxID=28930 RepID=A0A2N9EZK0_FAGSY
MKDGETLVSAGGGSFELGFFSPGNSKGRYLGIWYTISTETVVWVANRESPLDNHSGVLKVNQEGDILLVSNTNTTVWSSNTSRAAANPVAQLLDSGNLVVKDGDDNGSEKFLWQSFDYPCDTLLPGMKMGMNSVTGLDWFLTSWKSTEDPAQGEFSFRIDRHGFQQLVVMEGDKIKARAGSWNGLRFTGYPALRLNPVFQYKFVLNENEVYYDFTLMNSSVFSRLAINPLGTVGRFTWMDQETWLGALRYIRDRSIGLMVVFGGLNWNAMIGDGFLKYTGLKLPDTSSAWFNMTMSLKECEGLCLKNCSCTAYSNVDIRGEGSGCLRWFGNLDDMRIYSQGGQGQDLYIRLANSELGITRKDYDNEGRNEDMELPLFDFMAIANATCNFSSNNKLGEGGFGPVYKGTLQEGQVVAVKRLSKNSGQGLNELKNEVLLIAKLQHRNLVKLLDQTKSKLLDWHKRINIIGGVARGLLYLHQDSRLRIIHRDLKASNILLDNDMNPKISDFGIAKSFGGDQGDAKTNRIIGTYGYMSPEYAVHGKYSIKSDVFSFGVLILEIVSGKKNRGFCHPENHLNLLGHAWRLWIEDRAIELIDDLVGAFTLSEVLRCIHVGLLCVQQRQEDRPNMWVVVLMLSSEILLPKPRQPGFYTDSPEADYSPSTPCSENEFSSTLFEAR